MMAENITYIQLQPLKSEEVQNNTIIQNVPIIDEMDLSKICLACLRPNAARTLSGDSQAEFQQVTGILINNPVFPKALCAWCVRELNRTTRWRRGAVAVQNQLQTLYHCGTLNLTTIQQTDRKSLGLNDNLTKITISPLITIEPKTRKHSKTHENTETETIEIKIESNTDYSDETYLSLLNDLNPGKIKKTNLNTTIDNTIDNNQESLEVGDADISDGEPIKNDFSWSDDSDSDLEKPLNKLKVAKEVADFTSESFLQQVDDSIQNFKEEVAVDDVEVKKRKTRSSKKSTKANKKYDVKVKRKVKKEEAKEEEDDGEIVTNKEIPKSGKGARSENMEIKHNLDKWFTVRKLTPDEQYEEFEKRKENKAYTTRQYKCHYCYNGFSSQSVYDKHMEKHKEKRKENKAYTTRQYKCHYCYNGFSSQSVYDKHMEKHKERPDLPFSCPLCRFYYPDKRGLVRHALIHQKLYYCRSCDYVTDSCHMAILHVNWHNGKEYKCKHCPDVFKLLPTLVNHVRIKHPTDHVCALCGYSFVGDKGLAAHRKLKHDGVSLAVPEDGPMCVECNIQFANEDALGIHHSVSLKHENYGKRVNNNASQARSIEYKPFGTIDGPRPRAREVLRPVDCEKCGITLRSFRQYQMHFRKQHPTETRTQFSKKSRPVLCDLCGKTFPKPYFLREHMNEHTKSVIHKCEYCERTYTNRFKYLKHRAVHRGVRYSCPTCPMTFNNPSNRYRHVKYVHSNERNVKCQFCEKSFKSEAELKLHTDHVHFKKPWPKRSRNKRDDNTAPSRVDCRRKRDGNMLIGYDTSAEFDRGEVFVRDKEPLIGHLV